MSRTLEVRLKRLLDLGIASAAIVVLAPAWLIIACWIRIDSRGPIIYRQNRIGRRGRLFRIWKFRTMRQNAEAELASILADAPEKRLDWEQRQKLLKDPRLTRSGLLLRRHSLDELPQLVNVLKGDMSLVGPRPCLPDQQGYFGDRLDLYTSVRPGLTGLWQVSGRNNLSFNERVDLDTQYVQTWSLSSDLRILLKTIPAVMRADGAY